MTSQPTKQSKELSNAFYDDWKRKVDHRMEPCCGIGREECCMMMRMQVVDDAKKRAVGQNVDYETFKNMVSVAHLKPLQAASVPKNGTMAPRTSLDATSVSHEAHDTDRMLPSWRYNADGSMATEDQGLLEASALALMQGEPQEPASSSGDFYREWRRNCPSPEAKYRYLRLCGPSTLTSIFRVEISTDVLKDIVAVLEGCWQFHAGAAEESVAGSALLEASFALQV